MGEEFFKFAIELSAEGFIMRDDEGWFLDILDDLGDSEGFTGSGDAEEGLEGEFFEDTVTDFLDGFGLVAGGLVWSDELELIFHIGLKY